MFRMARSLWRFARGATRQCCLTISLVTALATHLPGQNIENFLGFADPWRVHRIRCLVEPHLIKRLALSHDTVERIRETLGEQQRRWQEQREAVSDTADPQQSARAWRDQQLDEQRQALQLLSEQQRRQFAATVGTPFDLKQLGRVAFRAPPLDLPQIRWLESLLLDFAKRFAKQVFDFRLL